MEKRWFSRNGLQELDTTELVQLIAKREKQQKRVRSEIPGHFKGCCYYGGWECGLSSAWNRKPDGDTLCNACPKYDLWCSAIWKSGCSNCSTKCKKKKAPTRAEFLSGFYKADKLRPVITLVLHFGADPWDGATSLHEMMDFPLEEMRTFIQDYKIHLIDPAALEPDELENFQPVCGKCSAVLKYSKDKEKTVFLYPK